MAIENNIVFEQDLAKPVCVRHLPGSLYEYDNSGLCLSVALYKNGVPVNATGDVEVTTMRADGTTAPSFTSSISGNIVTVKVPSGALMPGLLRFVVKLISGNVKTTILAVTGAVVAIEGSQYVDPGSVIPSLSSYENMVDAIQSAATIVASLSTEATPIEGDRYRCLVNKS